MLVSVLAEAEKTYKRYCEIMTEEETSEEEQLERYKNYVLRCHAYPKNAQLLSDVTSIEMISTIDNKIVADDEDTYEYENEGEMTHDIIFLCSSGKLESRAVVDIFGKKTSVDKIVEKLYKKFPSGLPDKDKFYHTRREAYEDGALKL